MNTENYFGAEYEASAAMTVDQKIRLGLVALSVISSAIVAAHFGHAVHVKLPFLDEIGGPGSE